MKLKFVLVYFNVWNVFQVIYAPASMCFSLCLSLSLPSLFFSLKQGKKNIWELIGFPGLAARHCNWSPKRWICQWAGHEFDNQERKGRNISLCTLSKRGVTLAEPAPGGQGPPFPRFPKAWCFGDLSWLGKSPRLELHLRWHILAFLLSWLLEATHEKMPVCL